MRSEQEGHSGGAQLSCCHGTSVTLTDNQLSHVWQTHRVASRRVAVPLAEGMQLLRRYFSNYTKIRKNRCTRTFWASAERCGEAIERGGGWGGSSGQGEGKGHSSESCTNFAQRTTTRVDSRCKLHVLLRIVALPRCIVLCAALRCAFVLQFVIVP